MTEAALPSSSCWTGETVYVITRFWSPVSSVWARRNAVKSVVLGLSPEASSAVPMITRGELGSASRCEWVWLKKSVHVTTSYPVKFGL